MPISCFPSIPTMAEQHIFVSTVKRALHELVDAGYIEKNARFRDKNRGQTSNLYTLLFVEQAPAPDNDNPTADSDSDSIDTPVWDAETTQSHYQPTDLSFETIAQQTTVQEQPEEVPAKEAASMSTGMKSPVHLRISRLLVCRDCHVQVQSLRWPGFSGLRSFPLWTGAESSLIPP